MLERKLTVRVFTFVVAALLVVGSFSGCGNKETGSENKESKDKPVTLSVATAGDTNMLELFKNKINPEFTKKYPNVTVNVVGTGAGDSGSRNIYTKLKAQKEAKVEKWDIDLAVVHQSIMADMMKDGLAAKYVDKSGNKALVVGENSKNSLGTNVEGYVIPMFNSQTVIAYNPKLVKDVPKTFDELVEWIKKNPKKFGYNGVKGGMSGVSFATAYVYWRSGKYDVYTKGPYDKANESSWPDIMKELKSLPVTMTQGNAGTLDMINRGEILMGPVWVDMFYSWIAEGRMDPEMKLVIPSPGMPGQPMYFMISEKAANSDAAVKYIDYVTSPEVQAEVIVGQNRWYPGVDASKVLPVCPQKAKDELFKYITAEDLAQRGLMFPLAPYLKDIISTYEEN